MENVARYGAEGCMRISKDQRNGPRGKLPFFIMPPEQHSRGLQQNMPTLGILVTFFVQFEKSIFSGNYVAQKVKKCRLEMLEPFRTYFILILKDVWVIVQFNFINNFLAVLWFFRKILALLLLKIPSTKIVSFLSRSSSNTISFTVLKPRKSQK